jgi:hypothetical protein
MRRTFGLAALVGFIAVAVVRMQSKAGRLVREIEKRAHIPAFVDHPHDATVHEHEHSHVTHNRREGPDEIMGEWEHLTALHGHEHNHSAIAHRHLAHEDAQHEHLGEAHIHDHGHPTTS